MSPGSKPRPEARKPGESSPPRPDRRGGLRPFPIVVCGAGPAGLMAAAEAALAGCPVRLLEKMPAPGRKLLITGSGRCNVTNACEPSALPDAFFSGARFLRGAFSRFSNRDLAALLTAGGVPLVKTPEGKLFPASDQARDVLDFLLRRAEAAGVEITCAAPVRAVLVENGRVTGVRTGTGDIAAGAVVLAMGGRSWPVTGSSGDGTRLAAALGHAIVPERPALVPLVLADQTLRVLQGLALRDIALKLEVGGHAAGQASGDLLFTHFGVSGPAVLRVSRLVPEPWPAEPVQLVIDLLPGVGQPDLDRQLLDRFAAEPRRQVHNLLAAWLPAAFSTQLVRLAGLPADLEGGRVTRIQRKQLLDAMKGLRLTVTGSRGWREAIVTAGGVALKEVDPKTMASRLVKGLYLAGEMLDIDADTGGFNLQAAFSTGTLAGRSAADYLRLNNE